MIKMKLQATKAKKYLATFHKENIMLDKNSQVKQKNKDLQNYIKLLSDEQKIKLWIKTLISVQTNLPEIINSVDKIIEANASSLSFASDIYNAEKSTMSQVEKVIDLTERKNKLLNVYLISKNLLNSLCENERVFIKRKFIYNWTAEELAQEEDVSIRTIFRRTDKILDKIYEFTKRKNWSLGFILMQVKNESWLHEKFNRYAKDSMNTTCEKNSENFPSTQNEPQEIALGA